jgi:hypothetical protein
MWNHWQKRRFPISVLKMCFIKRSSNISDSRNFSPSRMLTPATSVFLQVVQQIQGLATILETPSEGTRIFRGYHSNVSAVLSEGVSKLFFVKCGIIGKNADFRFLF